MSSLAQTPALPAFPTASPGERLIRLSTALRKLQSRERVDPVEWAGVQPWFRRRGLKTVEDVVTGRRTVIYNEHAGWDAIEEFFYLTPVLAEMLFSQKMVKGRSPKEVAKRIDTLVRHGGDDPDPQHFRHAHLQRSYEARKASRTRAID